MKKTLTFLITLILIVSINPVFASAKTVSAGIGLNSFFYFFDIAFEEINLFFTFNPEKKAKTALEYADERIAELAEIQKDKEPEIYIETVNRYQQRISYAKEISAKIEQSEKKENLFALIADKQKENTEIIPFVATGKDIEMPEILDDVKDVESVDVGQVNKQKPEVKKETKPKVVQQVKKPVVTKIEAKDDENEKELERLRAEVEEMKKEAEEKEKQEKLITEDNRIREERRNAILNRTYENLTATCKSKQDVRVVSQPVQWSVDIRGGDSPYDIEWSGSDSLRGDDEHIVKSYPVRSSEYTATASVSISSNDGQDTIANCSVRIIPETVVETIPEPEEEVAPELSYNDLNCPKVTKLEDNQGNIRLNSNTLKGSISASQIETLKVTITATDPNGDIIRYRYSPGHISKNNPRINFWSENNKYELLGSSLFTGGNRTLFVALNDEDDYSCIGANYDVSVKFIYEIAP